MPISPMRLWRCLASGLRSALGALALTGLIAAPNAATADAGAVASAARGAVDAKTPPEGVALWRVSDADSEIWILGSVHLLDPALNWRRPAIDAAIASAERAYFETPLDLAAQAQAMLLVMQLGVQPQGRRLTDQLSDKGRRDFDAAARKLSFSKAQFENLRPWLAMLQIASLSFKKQGLEAEAGVESVLLPELLKRKVEIRYLETIEQQMRFLSDLPEADQVQALEAALGDLDQIGAQLDRLVRAWKTGDLAGLEAENAKAAADSPAVHEALIIRRNKAWIDALRRELAGSGVTLVVVGAAHLVGDIGVPALLRAEGVTVERR